VWDLPPRLIDGSMGMRAVGVGYTKTPGSLDPAELLPRVCQTHLRGRQGCDALGRRASHNFKKNQESRPELVA
jgi:hypothetical protein